MRIEFYQHAKNKFRILRKYGFSITERQVKEAVLRPEKVAISYRVDRFIAEKKISNTHKLRVIFERGRNKITIITFYPTRRIRYEK